MWTVENRVRYNQDRLRYPSDLTDEEWGLGVVPQEILPIKVSSALVLHGP